MRSTGLIPSNWNPTDIALPKVDRLVRGITRRVLCFYTWFSGVVKMLIDLLSVSSFSSKVWLIGGSMDEISQWFQASFVKQKLMMKSS